MHQRATSKADYSNKTNPCVMEQNHNIKARLNPNHTPHTNYWVDYRVESGKRGLFVT